MLKLVTHGLEKFIKIPEFNHLNYSYDKWSNIYSKLIVKMFEINYFPKLLPKEFKDIFINYDLYIDTLTYYVINNYNNYQKKEDLPIYCYVYIIIARPFMYNIIMTYNTNKEIMKFKNKMLKEIEEIILNNNYNYIKNIKNLLLINEFEDYDKSSALQQFKYFIDAYYDYNTMYANSIKIFNKPDYSYIIVHLSYNNNDPSSIFVYNNTQKINNITSLTEDYIKKSKIIKTFDNIYTRDILYEIVDNNFNKVELSDRNIIVMCYDNAEKLSDCKYTECKYFKKEFLTKIEAERKLKGEVYHTLKFDECVYQFDMFNLSKYYDEPEVYDNIKAIELSNIIKNEINIHHNYQEFVTSILANEDVNKIFDETELKYFKLYLLTYSGTYDNIELYNYIIKFYNYDFEI